MTNNRALCNRQTPLPQAVPFCSDVQSSGKMEMAPRLSSCASPSTGGEGWLCGCGAWRSPGVTSPSPGCGTASGRGVVVPRVLYLLASSLVLMSCPRACVQGRYRPEVRRGEGIWWQGHWSRTSEPHPGQGVSVLVQYQESSPVSYSLLRTHPHFCLGIFRALKTGVHRPGFRFQNGGLSDT